ncbi:MFS transporter [Pseudonocardia sp. GCM10023141]|uniref:MFS transporter n=1 Tax=Pseudonocardia sp. GCM10023141 TaxID=3252653 RepID=UPI003611E870
MSARTLLLAAGAFAVGTSAYVVTGVLPAVSAELGVSVTTAGQLSTVFALSYAVGAPLLATLTGRWDRRTLLVAALLLAAVGNALAAVSTNFPVLVASRVVSALGAAVYTPAATVVATQFHAPEHRGRAVAMVFGGLTFALVLGVPAGSILGPVIGFHGVFGLIAAASVLAAIAVRSFLPAVAAPAHIGLRDRLAVAADRRVLTMLGVTVFGVLGAMSVYTYVVPLLAASAAVAGPVVSALLLVYGLGALLGNAIGGRATDRWGSRRTLLTGMVGFTVLAVTMPVTMTTIGSAAVVLFFWSMFTWSVNPPIQNLLLGFSATSGGLLLSLNASAIYLGAGLSGVVGGVVIATLGVLALPLVGAVLGAIGVGLFVLLGRQNARAEAAELAEMAPVPSGM